MDMHTLVAPIPTKEAYGEFSVSYQGRTMRGIHTILIQSKTQTTKPFQLQKPRLGMECPTHKAPSITIHSKYSISIRQEMISSITKATTLLLAKLTRPVYNTLDLQISLNI